MTSGFARAWSRASVGMEAPAVRVEAHVGIGTPAFTLVGLPETAVRESRDRVRSAIVTSAYTFPTTRLTVNLSPADLPKHGGRFDLPIALAILGATGQLDPKTLEHFEFLAELSLGGDLRPVRGALLAAAAAGDAGRPIVVAGDNGAEAALPEQAVALPARQLSDVVAHLAGGDVLTPTPPHTLAISPSHGGTLTEVRGHHAPKRALILAAAGGHNLLMHGPPGTGKTLLARCLPNLLPPLTALETMEVAAIHSLAGRLIKGGLPPRPFRAPHHSATAAALVGGGSDPVPGEISLAHHGVLFLDELPEFTRGVLENLREPLESGMVAIARARARVEFPAAFQLVAAMNPCPAGRDCRGGVTCVCPPDLLRRYQSRLSAPLLDRIDLQVEVPAVPVALLADASRDHGGQEVSDCNAGRADDRTEDLEARAVIAAARRTALDRQGVPNARLGPRETDRICRPDAAGLALLERAAARMGLSARGWHRALRVARTLADMRDKPLIGREEIAEALAYRERFGADAAKADAAR